MVPQVLYCNKEGKWAYDKENLGLCLIIWKKIWSNFLCKDFEERECYGRHRSKTINNVSFRKL